jgi:hypothetical protein
MKAVIFSILFLPLKEQIQSVVKRAFNMLPVLHQCLPVLSHTRKVQLFEFDFQQAIISFGVQKTCSTQDSANLHTPMPFTGQLEPLDHDKLTIEPFGDALLDDEMRDEPSSSTFLR